MIRTVICGSGKRIFTLLLAVGMLLIVCACSNSSVVQSDGPEETTLNSASSDESAGASSSAAADTVTAVIDIADYGKITVELDPDAAPATVENFVKLANEGFYDGLTFHRIMDGFMMQGGDPTRTGTGGSDETIVGEFAENGHTNPISHVRGVISMARSSDMNSASSQFFIVQSDSTFLDGQYAGFGHVTDGMEVVDAVAAAAEPIDDNGTIASDAQPVITSITIVGPDTAASDAPASGSTAAE